MALLQSYGFLALLNSQGVLSSGFDLANFYTITQIITLTAGSLTLMWLGELITEKGIGNGISFIIFAGIVSRSPGAIGSFLSTPNVPLVIGFGIIAIASVAVIIAIQEGQRRIPIQYASRVRGRRMYSGGQTFLPLRVNQAGVIPIIFASSILYFPTLLASVIHANWFQTLVNKYITNQASLAYMGIYGVLVVFFAYFYTAIAFNPVDTADNLRKYGGFVPGIRPGQPTADYLSFVLTRITLPGSIFLAGIALLPVIVLALYSIRQFPFGGTSLLITIGVALETMKQLESQLLMRHYEGFLS
jgi:preprotein translocase subunit SecY